MGGQWWERNKCIFHKLFLHKLHVLIKGLYGIRVDLRDESLFEVKEVSVTPVKYSFSAVSHWISVHLKVASSQDMGLSKVMPELSLLSGGILAIGGA